MCRSVIGTLATATSAIFSRLEALADTSLAAYPGASLVVRVLHMLDISNV